MTDNFADAPQSIGELRSFKEDDMKLWSPRDVLIFLLREIDSGELNPINIVVCYRHINDKGELFTGNTKSAKDIHEVVGLLEVAKVKVLADLMGLS